MSIHPSLSSSLKHKKQRSVLKRIERIKVLMEKGIWQENQSIFGLPKIKTIRIKLKKEKVAKEAPAAETAKEEATTQAQAAAEQSTPGKKSKEKSEKK